MGLAAGGHYVYFPGSRQNALELAERGMYFVQRDNNVYISKLKVYVSV